MLTDFLVLFLPAQGLTGDIVLNTLYGGIAAEVPWRDRTWCARR